MHSLFFVVALLAAPAPAQNAFVLPRAATRISGPTVSGLPAAGPSPAAISPWSPAGLSLAPSLALPSVPSLSAVAQPAAPILLPGDPSYEAAVSGLLRREPASRPLEEALLAPREFGRALQEVRPLARRLEPAAVARSRVSVPGEPAYHSTPSSADSAYRLANNLAIALGIEKVEETVDEVAALPRRLIDWRRPSNTSAAHFDPATRTLVTGGLGSLAARKLGSDGKWKRSSWRAAVPGRYEISAVHLDSQEGLLISAAGYGQVEARRVGPRGPVGPPVRLRPFRSEESAPDRRQVVTGIAYDRQTRTIYLAGHAGLVEVRRWPLREEKRLQRIRINSGGVLISVLLDPKSRALLFAFSNGQVEARRLEDDGRVSEQAFAKVFVDHRAEFESASFDPESRRLLLGAHYNSDLAVLRVAEDGAPLLPARSLQGADLFFTRLALAGDLVLSAGHRLVSSRLPEPAPSDRGAWKGDFLRRFEGALASDLADNSSYFVSKVAENILAAGDPALVQSVWRRLSAPALEGGKEGLRALRPFWAPGARKELREKMPTLAAILADPARVGSFLEALGALRLLFPYSLSNASPMDALAWARSHGLLFPLGELVVAPVSESFRRYIVALRDGSFAVELKIPGEQPHRKTIFEEHYTLARALWREAPDDPGVVRPLHLGRFAGHVRIYGQDLEYKPSEPLGVFVSEYREGKRLYNSDAWLPEVARRLGQEPAAVRAEARADAAATAFRLHRMGWAGTGEKSTDMHPENVRLTADGHGTLVADFGAFHQTRLTWSERARETLALLQVYDRNTREALVPLVLRRLARDPQEQKKLKRQVRLELGL